MPGIVTVEYAAKKIMKDLKKSRYEVAFPFFFTHFMKFLRLLPNNLFFFIIRKFVWKR